MGGGNVEFHREQIASNYVNSEQGRGKGRGAIVGIGPVGIGGGKTKSSKVGAGSEAVKYRTVGICHDCGHTWTTQSDMQPQYNQRPAKDNTKLYWILALIFLAPFSWCYWFYVTPKINMDKKTRGICIAGFFVFLLLFYIVSPKEPANSNVVETPNASYTAPVRETAHTESTPKPEATVKPELSATEVLIENGLPARYADNMLTVLQELSIDVKGLSFSKTMDWAGGEQFSIEDGMIWKDYYIVYFNADNTVAQVYKEIITGDGGRKLIWSESEHNNAPADVDGVTYVLKYNEAGEFGKEDVFSGDVMLRHYIPAGDYVVTTPGGARVGFYIEKREIYKEDGWDTSDTVAEYIGMDANTPYEVTVKDDECLLLIVGTILYVTKK